MREENDEVYTKRMNELVNRMASAANGEDLNDVALAAAALCAVAICDGFPPGQRQAIGKRIMLFIKRLINAPEKFTHPPYFN